MTSFHSQKNKNPFDVLNISQQSTLNAEDIEKAYRKERISLESKSKHLTTPEVRELFEDLEKAFQDLIEILEVKDQSSRDQDSALSAFLMPGISAHMTTNEASAPNLRSAVKPVIPFEPRQPIFGVNDSEVKNRLKTIVQEAKEIRGSLLKTLREEAKLKLEDISARIKINLHHLIALENESYHTLPAPVYVKGFLFSYLKYLGIENETKKFSDAILKIIEEKK
jgi:hypothetical protein